MGPKVWETTNGMQEHTHNTMELTRTSLDRGKTVYAVKNHEIEISNDDEIRHHKRPSATSKLQAPTKKTSLNKMPPPTSLPPPDPPQALTPTAARYILQ